MREIEFRAWLKNEKFMLNNITSIRLDTKCIYYDDNQLFSYERKEFDEIELMQYTGLKDTNGVKIFEGDIVENIYFNSKYELFWDEENCCFRMRNIDDDYDYLVLNIREAGMIEVIGNIYEDKELLNENFKFN